MLSGAVDLSQKLTALWMVVLIGVLGVIGVLTLAMLAVAWRRHLARQRRAPDGARASDMPDIWAESGRRLASRLDQPPTNPSTHDDDPSNESENPPDSDLPRR